MTQEDKQLLLKDLCTRLPYKIKIFHRGSVEEIAEITPDGEFKNRNYDAWFDITTCKLYLRSMSSMTEEEQQKYYDLTHQEDDDVWAKCLFDKMVDFCNERHLDFRGLIEKGLALEAPSDMYKV